jgi:hypothetical protein
MRTGSLDPVSNRASFEMIRQCIDTETGEAIDLTGATLVFEIKRHGECSPVLSATTDNAKITFPDAYTYQVNFTLDEMRTLCAQTYDVGVTFERGDETVSIIIGTLPVLAGNVS